MKNSTRFPLLEQYAPSDACNDGILTLLSILLGEIVIIDVMGL